MDAAGPEVIRVSDFVTLACNKLMMVTKSGVSMPSKLRRDLQYLLDTMNTMLVLLRDAVQRGSINRRWLRVVKDAAFRIWDMIDEFWATKGAPVSGLFPSVTNAPKATLARKTREVKRKLKSLNTRRQGPYAWWTRSLEAAATKKNGPYSDNATIIGREEEQMKIIEFLSSAVVATTREQGLRPVIFAIFGLAGVGKTALAKWVFDHSRFQDYLKAWVHVSQEVNIIEIGNSVISQVSEATHIQAPKDILRPQRLLIVLDDLWEAEYVSVLDDLWEAEYVSGLKIMRGELGINFSEVIVIVTTRSQSIAQEICTTSEPYKLHPLSDDMCWAIIKRTCHFENWLHHIQEEEELEKVGREVARMCWGLPLAAQAIGSSINPPKWSAVLSSRTLHDTGYLPPIHSSVLSSLRLSYQHMPEKLRLCFAYCAIFPRGHVIFKQDLVHQWIALHLIDPFEKMSARQELGEKYITLLMDISFLQITSPNLPSETNDDMNTVSFTMHDAVHSLARSEIDDLFAVLDGRNTSYCAEKYCRYALLTNFDDTPRKLHSILPAKIKALRLLCCSKIEFCEDSFSFAKYLGVLDLREPSMHKLPDSICQLELLGYLNLSGCSGLETLPESIGNLISLVHVDLSSCSGLVKLPESFGKLRNMAYIDLSNCYGLVDLPNSFGDLINLMQVHLSGCSGLRKLSESFGNLINLVHVDLSGCSGLVQIPESFRKLENVKYLDLSSCSLTEGIPSALNCLTNLQHLNLANPCCFLVQHRLHLTQLKDVWGKLRKLRYLNLSMFLNAMFYYFSEENNLEYIECFSGLTSLEHLDLSHNIFLFDLPESICKLTNLHTLDLSGCIRLKRIDRRIAEMNCLKSIVTRNCQGLETFHFAVHVDDGEYGSNLVELEDVIYCKEQEISCLEKVKSVEEAKRIRLVDKQNLQKLRLSWSLGSSSYVGDEALLTQLVPPHTLQSFELCGHNGRYLPDWLLGPSIYSHLPNLVELTMEDIPRWIHLPPLGLLPQLQRLVLRRMTSITSINADELSGGNRGAFHRLSQLTLDDMQQLEKFISCGEKFKFPDIDALVVQKCRKLTFQPSPPTSKMRLISACDQLMSSSANKGEGDPFSTAPAPITEVVVEAAPLAELNWSLLRHLPPLHSLHISKCNDLATSPEIKPLLTSLNSLNLSNCDSLVSRTNWLGKSIYSYLPNLVELTMEDISRCTDLPPLGLLPDLQRLVLRRMVNLTRINASDLSCGYRAAFRQLSLFILDDMENLEEFRTTYYSGGEECMFPTIKELVIQKCRKLRFQPYKPSANMLLMSACDQLMSTSVNIQGGKEHDVEVDGTSSPSFTSAPITELVVQDVHLAKLNWSLLDVLPPLYSLHIKKCIDLTILPEIMPLLKDLKSLVLSQEDSHLGSRSLPEWLGKGISKHLPNLVEVTMQDISWLSELPPFGLLPNLQRLVFRKMSGVERIKAADLSGCSTAAFSQLLHFKLDDMTGLKEFNTTYRVDDEEFTLPTIDELVILKCHKLMFQPCIIKAKMLLISDCGKLTPSSMKREGAGRRVAFKGHPSSSTTPISVPGTQLAAYSVPLAKLNWRLLQDLPPLHSLQISNCNDLNILPEIMPLLPSVKSLVLAHCERLVTLPSWLGKNISSHLPNLVEVTMENIPMCSDLPQLGLLQYLQRLVLRRMPRITRIHDNDLCGGSREAFQQLSRIIIEDMENLEEFNTTYSSNDEDFLFPKIHELVIQRCPRLRCKPDICKPDRPRPKVFVISSCGQLFSFLGNKKQQLMSSAGEIRGDGMNKGPSNSTCTISAEVAELVIISHAEKKKELVIILDTRLDELNWSFLHDLHPFHSWHISSCNDLTVNAAIPEAGNKETIIPREFLELLSSLKSLYISHCDNLVSLRPNWLGEGISKHLPNLVEVTMEDIPRCGNLPPLGRLPSLQRLVLRRMSSIKEIKVANLIGGSKEAIPPRPAPTRMSSIKEVKAADLIDGSKKAFPKLLHFTLEDMPGLEEFNIEYYSDITKFTLREIDEFVILKCPRLRCQPCIPRAKMLLISDCQQLISSSMNGGWGSRDGVEEDESSSTSTSSSPVTELAVQTVQLDKVDWRLLQDLPPLHCLHVRNSSDLTIFPENLKFLSNLKLLCVSLCNSLTTLPENLCNLTSLQELVIDRCDGIKTLPQCIDKLTNLKCLRIQGCPQLRNWCELEENRIKFSHITSFEEHSN